MFPERLKKLRTSIPGLTQSHLAEQLDVSQQAVGLWERGKNMPSHDLINRLAKYFDVTTDYLLGLTDNPQQAPAAADRRGVYLTDPREIDHIQKYRALDERGKDNVDATTEHEYQYASPEARAEKQSG